MLTRYKTLLIILVICSAIIGLKALAQQAPGQKPMDEKPTNLKVLPKTISHDDLMKIMHGYCKALGVHCTECHAMAAGSTQDHPQMDFASDANAKKNTARDMIKMVNAINGKYLGKIDNGMLEQINCVTCHNGHTKPIVNVDSLAKMQMPMH
jgi:hypothetical protein